jgi:murein DD-endopeptidase MepM/ murein hydrolase activator NlpD
MGKSSKRNKKRSRADLLTRNQNSNHNDPTQSPTHDLPSSTFFAKIAPIIVQFAVTWIIIVCSIKLLKAYDILPKNNDSDSSGRYNETVAKMELDSVNSIVSLPADIAQAKATRTVDGKNNKIHEENVHHNKVKLESGKNVNVMNRNNNNDKVEKFEQFISKSKDYPNLLNITPELQKLFHPVIKFPVKRVNEELAEQNIHGAAISTSGEMEATTFTQNKKKTVKKQLYRVLDLKSMTGSSQLIHPNDQDEYRKERQKEKKNMIQTLFFKLSNNQSAIEELYSVGKYDENRKMLYSSELFHDEMNDIDGYDGARTVHMGIDLGGPVGTKVHSFWDGIVHSVGYNDQLGDYGYVIIVQYNIPSFYSLDDFGDAFKNVWALYGHLDNSVLKKKVGQKVKRGEVIGRLGNVHENGGWKSPHVHFQLSIIEPKTHDMPGAVALKDRKRALLNYPDPRYVLGPLY